MLSRILLLLAIQAFSCQSRVLGNMTACPTTAFYNLPFNPVIFPPEDRKAWENAQRYCRNAHPDNVCVKSMTKWIDTYTFICSAESGWGYTRLEELLKFKTIHADK